MLLSSQPRLVILKCLDHSERADVTSEETEYRGIYAHTFLIMISWALLIVMYISKFTKVLFGLI